MPLLSAAPLHVALMEVFAVRGEAPDACALALADALGHMAAGLDASEGPLALPLDTRLDAFIERVRQTHRRALESRVRG